MYLNQEELEAPAALTETGQQHKPLEDIKLLSLEVRKWFPTLEACSDVAEKINTCLEFMKSKISNSSPKFKEFWEVRRMCLPLFKENVAQKIRSGLWQQYVDLSIEARRLKGILDEQSSFASEQIELAIEALSSDLNAYDEKLSQMTSLEVNLSLAPFDQRKESYVNVQKELNLLSALASKVNALRKEAIKTEMRIRSKNKIFEKLSSSGDLIFPRRKELIRKISEEFSVDVSSFVKLHFEAGKKPSYPLHLLREEVKTLQALAKQLTLNTQSFTETRIALSFCWDLLKTWDKEKKKEIAELRSMQKKSYEDGFLKMKEFEELCLRNPSSAEVFIKSEEAFQFLKTLPELGSIEFRQFKEQLHALKRPFIEKEESQKRFFADLEKEQEALRFKKVQDLREKIQSLTENCAQMSLESLTLEKASLEESFKSIQASKAEKMVLDRLLKSLKDRFLEMRGKNLLLSDSDFERYEKLKGLLQEKKERRQEIKVQLESYRKSLGGSGFDFEKAMMYRELIESEREVLEKMNAAIEELESKMFQLEG